MTTLALLVAVLTGDAAQGSPHAGVSWETLIVVAGSLLAALGVAQRKIATLIKVARASVKGVEAFKLSMAAKGEPEIARELTDGIRDAVRASSPTGFVANVLSGPTVAAHAKILAGAGVNTDSILGRAIAAAAHPELRPPVPPTV